MILEHVVLQLEQDAPHGVQVEVRQMFSESQVKTSEVTGVLGALLQDCLHLLSGEEESGSNEYLQLVDGLAENIRWNGLEQRWRGVSHC